MHTFVSHYTLIFTYRTIQPFYFSIMHRFFSFSCLLSCILYHYEKSFHKLNGVGNENERKWERICNKSSAMCHGIHHVSCSWQVISKQMKRKCPSYKACAIGQSNVLRFQFMQFASSCALKKSFLLLLHVARSCLIRNFIPSYLLLWQ